MKRVAVPAKMARKLYELNANSCCVCKRTGVGLNLHHIDGDSSNTTEENLAVICVKDHDAHHRPNKYTALNHMDLSAERLHAYKTEWEEFVFLCRKGTPVKNSTYDTALFKICDKAKIPRFSMHILRHTFATRCIEAGMKPKTLQMLLGHSNIGITMNLYVHTTEEEKKKEMDLVAEALMAI